MKSNKNKLIFGLFLILSASVAPNTSYADEAIKKSLYGNRIYDGKNNPILSFPEWSAFFITSENCKSAMVSEGLSVKVSDKGGVVGYMLPTSEFNPVTDAFSFEHKSAVQSDSAGVSIDARWGEGKRVCFSVLSNCIINAVNGDTLIKNVSNTGFAHYRCKVDGTSAKIYKDSVELSSINTSRNDLILNPGFENNTLDSVMWTASSWAKREINSNTAHVNKGKYSLKFSNGANGKFFGTFNVQPNSTYRLSFYAKVSAAESLINSMQGGLFLNGEKVVNLPIATINFSKYTAEFTTGPADNNMQMILHNGFSNSKRCIVYLDDFELTQTQGSPYLQFGKLNAPKAADFITSSIAYAPEAWSPVAFTDYRSLLSKAKTLISTATIGTATGEYPQYAADMLNTEIANAEQLPTDGLSYSTIDSIFHFLDKSYTFFVNSKITAGDVKLASINASLESATIKRMHTTQINVKGVLSDGSEATFIPEQITYNVIGSPIVTVNENGLIHGTEIGSSKIEVVVQRNEIVLKDTLTIEVIDYLLSSIKLTPYQNRIAVGEATGVVLDIVMSDGLAPDPKLVSVKYNILTPGILEQNAFGSIIAKNAGIGKIEVSVTTFGKELKETIEISCYEPSDITLTIPQTQLTIGEKTSYTLAAVCSDNTEAEVAKINSLVVSENPNIATVDNQGNLLAVAKGEATIRFEVRLKNSIIKQSQTVTVTTISGMEKTSKENDLKVYPNPSTGPLTVEFEKGVYNQLKVFNMSGIEILNRDITGSAQEILSLEGLRGNYLLQLSSPTKSNTEKITIIIP